jgi:hypothetical protein
LTTAIQAFYINLPLIGVISPVYIFLFPSRDPRPDLTIKQKFVEIHWIGATLKGAVLVLFMIVVTFSGSTYAWNSGVSIALWVVFGVCLIAYILQQALTIFTTFDHSIFPVHFLKSRTLVLLYIATAGAAVAQATTLYYTPLFFQFTRGDSPLKAAVRLLPVICTFILLVMLAGGSLPVVGRYNLYYLVGGCLMVTGGGLLCTISETTATAKIYGYEILLAAGLGLVFQNAYAVAAAKVARKDQSKAIGFINVAQIGTIAIGSPSRDVCSRTLDSPHSRALSLAVTSPRSTFGRLWPALYLLSSLRMIRRLVTLPLQLLPKLSARYSAQLRLQERW